MLKPVINGETSALAGGLYEKKGSQITKYYPSGAVRRYTIPETMNLEYTVSTSSTQALTDHLNSTTLTTGIITLDNRFFTPPFFVFLSYEATTFRSVFGFKRCTA